MAGIKSAKVHDNIKELRGFLGYINYLRKYIPNYSQLQEPLTELLGKVVKFKINEKKVNAFETLKDYILDQVMLYAPAYSKDLVIACDASNTGIEAVLLHMQDGEEVPLEFASKSFSKAKRN